MRTLPLSLLLASLLSPGWARADATAPRPTPAPAPFAMTLVGVLTLQHTRQCTNGKEEWVDPHHEIGFVRVIPAEGVSLAPLVGKIVAAEGAATDVPEPPAARPGACPASQMRSDMVVSKSGMRRVRGASPFRGFRAVRVRPFDALTVRRAGDQVEVGFQGAFPQSLAVTLTAHYEGCSGKPLSVQRSQKVTVAPGQRVTAQFPARVDEASRQAREAHAISTLQVTSDVPSVAFVLDTDVPGPSACPPSSR